MQRGLSAIAEHLVCSLTHRRRLFIVVLGELSRKGLMGWGSLSLADQEAGTAL